MKKLPAAIAAYLPQETGRSDSIGCSGASVEIYGECVLKVQEA